MSERDAIIAVTDADREAYLSLNMLPELDAADIRAGRWDKLTGMQVMARHRTTHAGEVERLREEIADLKSSVIAFGAPWASQYAREFDIPPNHIHSTHYDILEKAGARMDSFVRHDPQALEASHGVR